MSQIIPNNLEARPSLREYVPETPEQIRRREAKEDFRIEVDRVRNNEPIFEAVYPLLDRWGNPAGSGWTKQDVADMEEDFDHATPMMIDEYEAPTDVDLGGPFTAEPARMSWEAGMGEAYMDVEDELLFLSPPRLRRARPVNYYESPFIITPGARENPIVIPDTPVKGSRENPIVID